MKEAKDLWKSMPWYLKLIILAVIAAIVFLIGRKLIVTYKKMKAEATLNNATATGTSGGAMYSTNFGSAAQRIYGAFYDNDVFGLTEDEEKAIIAVNDIPKAFMPQLKSTYFELYTKNLEADCIKYLGDEYVRVQNQFS